MAKLILNINDLTKNFFEDTRMLGITASHKNYKFCWQLNNELGFDFRLNPEIEILLRRKQRSYHFPVYEFHIPHTTFTHFLYNNSYDGEYLLPEFKHIDFLWLIKGDYFSDAQCNELIENIKNLNGVQMVTEINKELIKNKSHLIF
jgi:hypothetical protein